MYKAEYHIAHSSSNERIIHIVNEYATIEALRGAMEAELCRIFKKEGVGEYEVNLTILDDNGNRVDGDDYFLQYAGGDNIILLS